MSRIRVLLADDHALVRAGLRLLLERVPDVDVVGEAGSGRDAIALARTSSPDVVLLDIALPHVNGLEVAAQLREAFPEIRIIMLSMHANEEYVTRALSLGVSGYLLKDAAATELVAAIHAVVHGGIYLSPAISGVLADSVTRRGSGGPAGALTPRQRDILRRIAQGASTKEIAFALGLSTKTVESHRAQLMRRLGIYDVAGLVRYAIRAGLVSPAE